MRAYLKRVRRIENESKRENPEVEFEQGTSSRLGGAKVGLELDFSDELCSGVLEFLGGEDLRVRRRHELLRFLLIIFCDLEGELVCGDRTQRI